MLRFNFYQNLSYELTKQFQYILCYGSTITKFILDIQKNNFNTSYVTVQRLSIPKGKLFDILFQYILCYGSTKKKAFKKQCKNYFNTSYVTVQLPVAASVPLGSTIFQYILCYGSTVSVATVSLISIDISIHPMLRFNLRIPFELCT